MRSILSTSICCIIAILQVIAPAAYAQGVGNGLPDIDPPLIKVVQIDSSDAATGQVFTAEVTSDGELLDVHLYYRRSGQNAFAKRTMDVLGQSVFFSTTVPTELTDLRALEYYVQARDEQGNRAVSGFAFEPLVRSITSPLAAGTATTPAQSQGERITNRQSSATSTVGARDAPATRSIKWWHVALGVVAVGALVAAADGGSDGSTTVSEGDTVPLTITLGEPQ
jgi:hypothetical protein